MWNKLRYIVGTDYHNSNINSWYNILSLWIYRTMVCEFSTSHVEETGIYLDIHVDYGDKIFLEYMYKDIYRIC